MSGRTLRYYWDSCVILAHLKNEVQKHPEVPIIKRLLEANAAWENSILGSQIVKTEVLNFELNEEAISSFNAFYSQGQNNIADVDGRVAALAGEIRHYYRVHPIIKGNSRRGVQTPDAIHLATAIVYKVDEFHTLDIGILDLGDRVADKYDLNICKPNFPITPRESKVDDGQRELFDEDDRLS